ncbi:MAG: glycoside hydrolase family 16 protein [Planctomycetota bacterium]
MSSRLSRPAKAGAALAWAAALGVASSALAVPMPPNQGSSFVSGAPAGYSQIWSDEFNGSSLDTTKWTARNGLGQIQNRRDHYDDPAAITVHNGVLQIDTWSVPDSGGGDATHYSGRVSSNQTFTGGYYEARINFHTVPAMWSAFWLYNSEVYKQGGGAVDPLNEGVEVDIVEHRSWNSKPHNNANGNISDDIHQALHWNGYGAAHEKAAHDDFGVLRKTPFDGAGNIQAGSHAWSGWHTYGVEWVVPTNNDPGKYVFYLDGQPVWDTLLDTPQAPYDPATTGYSDPSGIVSGIPQWMILSSEVRDMNWAGRFADPSTGFGTRGASSNGAMQVDFVRVYEFGVADPLDINSVAELTWIDSGNAESSIVNHGGNEKLKIKTAKNAAVTAELPTFKNLSAAGSSLTVDFDIRLSHVPADANSTLGIGFADSTTGDYFYKVLLDPLADTKGAIFAEGGDNNLGKTGVLGFGTARHDVTFTLEGLGNGDLILTLVSDLLTNGSASYTLDVLPATTLDLDTIFFEFNGNAWNETFGSSNNRINATITNFSISHNPEPASLTLAAAAGLLFLRRRR